jgi:hypothetical protein
MIELENTLGRLLHAEDAPFNSYVKQHEPARLPNTRVPLLDQQRSVQRCHLVGRREASAPAVDKELHTDYVKLS